MSNLPKMARGRPFVGSAIAAGTTLIICCGLQWALYVNRIAWESAYTPASESTIYSAPPYLDSISHGEGGQLRLSLVTNGVPATLDEGNGPPIEIGAQNIVVTLQPGINRWRVKSGERDFPLVFEYTPSEVYAQAGNSSNPNGVVALRYSGLPTEKPIFANFNEWSPRVHGTLEPSLQLLHEGESGVTPEEMMGRLIARLEDRRGIPSDAIEHSALPEVAREVMAGRSSIWCTQIAATASESVGSKFPVRLLAAGGTVGGGDVESGGHAFNEVLDPATNRWMLSDPTNYIAGVRWQNGQPVNAAEFQRAVASPLSDPFAQMTFSFWSRDVAGLVLTKWSSLPQKIRDDLEFYFSPLNRIHYHTRDSSVYFKDFRHNLDNWARLDRRFILSSQSSPGAWAVLRVASFWFGVGSMFFMGFLVAFRLAASAVEMRRRRRALPAQRTADSSSLEVMAE